MKLEFTCEPERELDEAITFYESRSAVLGLAVAEEAHAAGQRILAHPLAWQRLDNDGMERRCRPNRFPYGLVYAIEGDITLVLAVMHLHRRPAYWRDRR